MQVTLIRYMNIGEDGEEAKDGVELIRGDGVFIYKQQTAYDIRVSLVGSELCIGDRH